MMGACRKAEDIAAAVTFLASNSAAFIIRTDFAVVVGYFGLGPE